MSFIPCVETLWSGKVKTTNTEEFSAFIDVTPGRTYVVCVELIAITGTSLTFDVETNCSGSAAGVGTEKIADDAIAMTTAGTTKTFTLPALTTGKMPASKLRLSVTGASITTSTFNAFVVVRAT